VLFSLLEHLKDGFADGDVALIAALLHAAGLGPRGDDPAAMKAFVLAVHATAADLGARGALSQRARLMLELIVDIKNNRKRMGGKAGGGATAALPLDVVKLVQGSNVEAVALRQLSWDTVRGRCAAC
jgi:nucleolar MIF4G domain-containing protein 1